METLKVREHLKEFKGMLDVKECLAEFFGTLILLSAVACNASAGRSVWGCASISCSFMAAIYALAPISGANFNPAVSLALGCEGKLAWQKVVMYIAAQISAGLVTALGYRLYSGPSLVLGEGASALGELVYTSMLVFVVLNMATVRGADHQFYGISIGAVIVAGAYGVGSINNGYFCFNPVVVLALDMGNIYDDWSRDWGLVHVGSELTGAVLASALFTVVRHEEHGRHEVGILPKFRGFTRRLLGGFRMLDKLTSEFLGTYMLVLTVGLNLLATSPVTAFSAAASLMCMIFAVGDVSGGHFNPAVTMSVLLCKHIAAKDAGLYIAVQLLGGILAACTYRKISNGTQILHLGPVGDHTELEVALAEIFFTFVLCFVALRVAYSCDRNSLSEYFGLAIGACVAAGGFAIGPISGGSLNPAVSFGIVVGDVIEGKNVPGSWEALTYTCYELIGGAAAAGLYRLMYGQETKNIDGDNYVDDLYSYLE